MKKKDIVLYIIAMLVGLLIGLFFPFDFEGVGLLFGLLFLFIAYYLTIIIHESGHLIFGLLTGYHFVSFRIGSIILIKNNDHISLKKYSIPGTGGQCLLSPPDLIDGQMPYKLYNLGGVIMNAIVFIMSFILFMFTSSLLSSFFFLLSIANLIVLLSNGIPLEIGGIYNDGMNLKMCKQNKEALYSLWLQLKINSELAKGKRLKDLPDQWFYIPKDLSNPLVTQIAVLYENKLLDQMKFSDALNCIDQLKESTMSSLLRELLYFDYLYCSIVTGKEYEDHWNTKSMKRIRKKLKNFICALRTEYAYAYDHNESVDPYLNRFNKLIQSYPYIGEIESEKELMRLL